MRLDFPVEKTVKERHSIRTYDGRAPSTSEKDSLNAYIAGLTNPFSVDISFHLLEMSEAVNGEKLADPKIKPPGQMDYLFSWVMLQEFQEKTEIQS